MSSSNASNSDKCKIVSFFKRVKYLKNKTILQTTILQNAQSMYNRRKSITFSPLPDMPILGSSNSAPNKDISKILTNEDSIFSLSRKHRGNIRNCSLRAISSFPTMFSKVVCCSCVKISIYGVKG